MTGHPDLDVVDKIIAIVLAYLDTTGDDEPACGSGGSVRDGGSAGDGDPDGDGRDGGNAGDGRDGGGPDGEAAWGSDPADGHSRAGAGGDGAGGDGGGGQGSATARSRALSPEAWRALRYAIARLAIDLASGPGGIASILRRSLLDEPFSSKSVILDVGVSSSIPGHLRHAVQLRARGHCEWPGCDKRAVYCDVHHLRHQQDGGATSLSNCVLLCQFHHDVCIHRRNWRLVLHPDATTTAYGPHGQVLHSHAPPGDRRSPGDTGPP